MSELDVTSNEYFDDHGPLLYELSGAIESLGRKPVIANLTMAGGAKLANISGTAPASDFVLRHPGISFGAAESHAGLMRWITEELAKFDANSLNISAGTIQAVWLNQSLIEADVHRQEREDRVREFRPVSTRFASWRRGSEEDQTHGVKVIGTRTQLLDSSMTAFAIDTHLRIEDRFTAKTISVQYFNGVPYAVHTSISPMKGEEGGLLERADEILGEEFMDTTHKLMAGVLAFPDFDLDANIESILVGLQNTPNYEVAIPLLDEVKTRFYTVLDARLFDFQFGTSQPNRQELSDLTAYVAGLSERYA